MSAVRDLGSLEAFRKQVRTMIAAGRAPEMLLLLWDGDAGVTRDDLIDILKEEGSKA